MNFSAQELLTSIRRRDGEYIAVGNEPQNIVLQSTIAHACWPTSSSTPYPPPLLVATDTGHLSIEVFALPPRLRHFHLECAGVLTVREAHNMARDPEQQLIRKYSTTRAEARLAMLVLSGRAPRQLAEDLSVAEGTVRQQLKSIYRKTGTSGRPDLIVLLHKLSTHD